MSGNIPPLSLSDPRRIKIYPSPIYAPIAHGTVFELVLDRQLSKWQKENV